MINELLKRYPSLNEIKESIKSAEAAIIECYKVGGKILLCGNGGSTADCEHITGELMKGFLKMRPLGADKVAQMQKSVPSLSADILNKLQCGLPAISLTSQSALMTAFCNDVDPSLVFAQQVLGLGNKNDILIAISTSGNSKNVLFAAKVAKALGLKVISLTGAGGGALKEFSDVLIGVPETETFKVQELHLPVYHYLCASVEEHFFKN